MGHLSRQSLTVSLLVFPEAPGSPPRRPDEPGEGEAVRDPHAACAPELLPHVALQVPDAIEADRRHIEDHVPAGVRPVQRDLLVDVPVPRRRTGVVRTMMTRDGCTVPIGVSQHVQFVRLRDGVYRRMYILVIQRLLSKFL